MLAAIFIYFIFYFFADERPLSPISSFYPKTAENSPSKVNVWQSYLPVQDQPLDCRSDSRKSPKKSRENSPIKREPLTSSPKYSPNGCQDSFKEDYEYENNIPFDLSTRRSRSGSRSPNTSPHSLPPKLANMSIHGKTVNDGGQGHSGNSPSSQLSLEMHPTYSQYFGSRGYGGGGDGGDDDLNGSGGSDGNGGNGGGNSNHTLSVNLNDEPFLSLVQPPVYPSPENNRFLPLKVADKSAEYPAPDFPTPGSCPVDNTEALMSQNSFYSSFQNGLQSQLQTNPLQTQTLMSQPFSSASPTSPGEISPMIINSLNMNVNGLRSPGDGHSLDSLTGMTQVSIKVQSPDFSIVLL